MAPYLKFKKGKNVACEMVAILPRPRYDDKSHPCKFCTTVAEINRLDRIWCHPNQAPVPLTVFRSNSRFDQNLECSSLYYAQSITKNFCTRHDSYTVVTCAKFLCGGIISIRLWITNVCYNLPVRTECLIKLVDSSQQNIRPIVRSRKTIYKILINNITWFRRIT